MTPVTAFGTVPTLAPDPVPDHCCGPVPLATESRDKIILTFTFVMR